MIIQHINWLAVAVSAIAYFALGAIWFNPKVFGTIWMKGHGITAPTEEDKKRMPMMMATTLVLCFIGVIAMAYFVHVFSFYQVNWRWYSGAKVGLVAGIGFTGVGIAMNYMYTKKSLTLIIIDSAYHLIGMVGAGIIMSVWR
ncbi:MAG: DUF1761 domain-containing protein [Bacteroidetes bacterium]|nr:DUF1761 domain-containing protein [Bacteroidota bacterium]